MHRLYCLPHCLLFGSLVLLLFLPAYYSITTIAIQQYYMLVQSYGMIFLYIKIIQPFYCSFACELGTSVYWFQTGIMSYIYYMKYICIQYTCTYTDMYISTYIHNLALELLGLANNTY